MRAERQRSSIVAGLHGGTYQAHLAVGGVTHGARALEPFGRRVGVPPCECVFRVGDDRIAFIRRERPNHTARLKPGSGLCERATEIAGERAERRSPAEPRAQGSRVTRGIESAGSVASYGAEGAL